MDNKNPFEYPLEIYIWVIGVACAGGFFKHINTVRSRNWGKLAVDVLTAGFTGVLTFWSLEAIPVRGPMCNVLIAVGGLMGNKSFSMFEALFKATMRFPREPNDANEGDNK